MRIWENYQLYRHYQICLAATNLLLVSLMAFIWRIAIYPAAPINASFYSLHLQVGFSTIPFISIIIGLPIEIINSRFLYL